MRSRGWDVLAWAHRYLPSPADPSQPLMLSDEQAKFVVAWYEVDETGVYVYRRGALEAAKGWGKSPLGAMIALAEFCGPVAASVPWIQLAACSEDQAVANTYSVIWSLLSVNENKAAHELGVDLGRGRLNLKSIPGAKLEPVSSSWGAREGQRLTFGLLDESQHFLRSNGGHKLARTLRRNAAKMDGRTLELANAPELGEESIAELTEAEAGHPGILFHGHRPSVEPSPEMDDAELLELLGEVYAGASWVDLQRLLREVRDPGAPWPEIVRFFFNSPSAGTLAAVDPVVWSQRRQVRKLERGERIVLGFDGSHSRDGTALVACTLDGHLWPIEIIERPANADRGWRIDRSRIHDALEHLFTTYDVARVFADPWTWQSELEAWAQRWPDRIVEWPTNTRKFAILVDRFRTGIAEGALSHDGDAALTRHVLNARLRPAGRDGDGRGTYVLEKPGEGRLIDACVAAVLAYAATAEVPEPTPRKFAGVMFG